MCGAVVGAVTWLSDMLGLSSIVAAGDISAVPSNPDQLNRVLTVAQQAPPLFSAFDIIYPIEFLLVTNVKLLVTHRLYASPAVLPVYFCNILRMYRVALKTSRLSRPLPPTLLSPFNVFAAVVNCGNLAGLAMRWLAAYYMLQASSYASAAAAAPSPLLQFTLAQSALDSIDSSRDTAHYQLVLEASVLVTIAAVPLPQRQNRKLLVSIN